MIELTNIKTKHTKRHAYIFDYGGTLDTNGIHWYNIFKEQHLKHNPQLCEDTIRQAYIYAEQMMDRTKTSFDGIGVSPHFSNLSTFAPVYIPQ